MGAEEASEESLELFTDSADAAEASSTTLTGTCGKDGSTSVTWKLENGVLTISGTGVMQGYYTAMDDTTGEILEKVVQPWEEYCDDIKKIVIEEGVTELGTNVFVDCKNLTSVTLPSTLKTIKHGAFANCKALTDINLGDSNVETIDLNVFSGTAITSLTLPKTLVKASGSAFNDMFKLTSIYVDSANTVFQSKDGVPFSDNGKTLLFYAVPH